MGLEMEWKFLEYPVMFDTLLLVLLEVVVELHCRSLGAEIRIWEFQVCESCWSSHILWVPGSLVGSDPQNMPWTFSLAPLLSDQWEAGQTGI